MKTPIGFAGSCMMVCAGLLMSACNSVSNNGLSSRGTDGSAKVLDGGAGSMGSGGSKGNGGAGGNGSGGTTGSGGALGSGGATGRGGAISSGGLTGAGGVTTSGGSPGTGGRLGSGGSGSGGTPGRGGGTGRGGSSGTGGVLGSGGVVVTGGTTARDAALDSSIPCGSRSCGAGQYCCSPSCGLCVPIGAACIAIACLDAGIAIDASACRAVPAADSVYCGGTQPPHAYACVLDSLPAPCVQVSVGNVTDAYCCP